LRIKKGNPRIDWKTIGPGIFFAERRWVMKRSFGAGVVALSVLLSSGLFAEEAQKTPRTDVMMKEVVVTGTRFEERIERIPANITVIDEEDIKNSNAGSIPDLLRSQEGIVVRDLLGTGKTAQVDLRGFGESAPYNVLVLVDGRRVNEIDLSGVDWTQIPIENIERIEILRGTGSVLYGDNAVGGVINIITRIPFPGAFLLRRSGLRKLRPPWRTVFHQRRSRRIHGLPLRNLQIHKRLS
jgi:outer membrane cobalamin receptor